MGKEMYDFTVLRTLRKRRGLTIADISDQSGVSQAVISRLERNQTMAELETLFKLGRVFGMNPSELLALAESQTGQLKKSSVHVSDDFRFQEVSYSNVRCLIGAAKKGGKVHKPRVHEDDYEVCWVLEGRVRFYLPNETYDLEAGDALQFDAILEHTYEALDDCRLLILHLRKGKRL
ncbi:MAG: helix-turn-helix domain-containing protein [Kiritimatiellae bacterium]|nr:helix-turn-helix domain-containing protein [Kiritimatiellia bacterium]